MIPEIFHSNINKSIGQICYAIFNYVVVRCTWLYYTNINLDKSVFRQSFFSFVAISLFIFVFLYLAFDICFLFVHPVRFIEIFSLFLLKVDHSLIFLILLHGISLLSSIYQKSIISTTRKHSGVLNFCVRHLNGCCSFFCCSLLDDQRWIDHG